MSEKGLSEKIIVLPYKDAYINDLIDPIDIEKFLENSQLKRDLDDCLNKIRKPEER